MYKQLEKKLEIGKRQQQIARSDSEERSEKNGEKSNTFNQV